MIFKKEYIMNETTLLNFISSFDEFLNKGSTDEYLTDCNLDMYYSLCEILSAKGYATLDQVTFEELFEFHVSEEYNGKTQEERLLSFILQLTHLGATHETLNRYSLNCTDYTELYQVLSNKSKASFANPESKSTTTFVYAVRDVLPILLEHNILIEK